MGAIAAGNTVVLKPSEHAPSTSSLIAKKIPMYLDSAAVKVFEGGEEVGELLMSKKWDHVFFTGEAMGLPSHSEKPSEIQVYRQILIC